MLRLPVTEMSIRTQLVLLVVLSTSLSLFVCAFLTAVAHWRNMRNNLANENQAVAEVLADNCSASLLFDQPAAATELLRSLQTRPLIKYAALVDNSGKIFADYSSEQFTRKDNRNRDWISVDLSPYSLATADVQSEAESIGRVVLAYSPADWMSQAELSILPVALSVLASFLFVVPFAFLLQKQVSRPIAEISEAMEQIVLSSDHHSRIPLLGTRELQTLCRSFNSILERMELWQNDLQIAYDDLERHVTERTHELAEANSKLQEEALRREDAVRKLRIGNRLRSLVQQVTDIANRSTLADESIESAIGLIEESENSAGCLVFEVESKGEILLDVTRMIMSKVELPFCTDFIKAIKPQIEKLVTSQKAIVISDCTSLDCPANLHTLQFDKSLPAILIPIFLEGRVKRVMAILGMPLFQQTSSKVEYFFQIGTQLSQVMEREKNQLELKAAQDRLTSAARFQGMADVASGILHNVGNVLNSINTSATALQDSLKSSRIQKLCEAFSQARSRSKSIREFVHHDAQGEQFLLLLEKLTQHIEKERESNLSEIKRVTQYVDHVKQIISRQQSYAQKNSGIAIATDITEMLREAEQFAVPSIERAGIQFIRDYADLPNVAVDRHKVLEILNNLLQNAKHAVSKSTKDPVIRLRSYLENSMIVIEVTDNGVGISEENLKKMFTYGFTTKSDGHGIGLHSCACAAGELNGKLSVNSRGTGFGATFRLEIPLASPQPLTISLNHSNPPASIQLTSPVVNEGVLL